MNVIWRVGGIHKSVTLRVSCHRQPASQSQHSTSRTAETRLTFLQHMFTVLKCQRRITIVIRGHCIRTPCSKWASQSVHFIHISKQGTGPCLVYNFPSFHPTATYLTHPRTILQQSCSLQRIAAVRGSPLQHSEPMLPQSVVRSRLHIPGKRC